MRYKKMLAAVMSVVMVLAGCNADKSADKHVEAVTTGAATSPVVEEVTTTTTTDAGTTTAEVTTIVVTTFTEAETSKVTNGPTQIQGEGRQNLYVRYTYHEPVNDFVIFEPVNEEELDILKDEERLFVTVMAESDLSWLKECTKLKELYISEGAEDRDPPEYNYVKDYSFLRYMTQLEHLSLGNCNFDISDIDGLAELSDFRAVDCRIAGRMSGETIFDKTETVKLVYDSIEDISFLQQFPNVTELWVSWTVMNDKAQLNVINNLTELKTLMLDQTDISSLTSLSGLKKLEELNICDDRIHHKCEIKAFDGLYSLKIFCYCKNLNVKQDDGTYIKADPYSDDEIAYFEKMHPDCDVRAYDPAF
ncbi:MAG: hypothetical protein IJ784_12170 [Ruminiclostridium sp.]|nr:hypothetical protein [Ruminiclostridium sp.]